MNNECSVAVTAVEIGTDETSEPFSWNGVLDLGPRFTAMQRSWFEPPSATATIRHFWLEQVTLDSSWGVLFRNEQRIKESKYLIFDAEFDNIRVTPDSVTTLPACESFGLGRNNGHNNYYHWLAQCLPAIEARFRYADPKAITLAVPRLTAWQERTLQLLGFASVGRLTLEPNRQYCFPRLAYSEYLNGLSSFQVSLLAKTLFQRMSQAVEGRPDVPSEIVYVARTDSTLRVVLNEAELIDQLGKRGVRIIVPGELSIDEQIRAFRDARLVLGPHGAGLANVAFCSEGATLYELFPSHYVNPCTNRLALAARMNYSADCFDTHPGGKEWVHSKSWSIDVRHVLERVDQIYSQKGASFSRRSETQLLREIMMDFESLGDNCEFGLVQRQAGAEPIGLLRFASPAIPIEQRLSFVSDALAKRFIGLGHGGTVSLDLAGEAGHREYVLRKSVYKLLYHTFKLEGEIDPDDFKIKESRRLEFLRRKLLNDLAQGEKIWVWKSNIDLELSQIETLLGILRAAGPNTLLWVARSDNHHPPGTIETLAADLIKGYVDQFAPYAQATQISFDPWFSLCRRAHEAWKLTRARVLVPLASSSGCAVWPLLSDRQCSVIAEMLKPVATWVKLSITAEPGRETQAFAAQLAEVFRAAGVEITIRGAQESEPVPAGIGLRLPVVPVLGSSVVFEALSRAGLISNINLDMDRQSETCASITIGAVMPQCHGIAESQS